MPLSSGNARNILPAAVNKGTNSTRVRAGQGTSFVDSLTSACTPETRRGRCADPLLPACRRTRDEPTNITHSYRRLATGRPLPAPGDDHPSR